MVENWESVSADRMEWSVPITANTPRRILQTLFMLQADRVMVAGFRFNPRLFSRSIPNNKLLRQGSGIEGPTAVIHPCDKTIIADTRAGVRRQGFARSDLTSCGHLQIHKDRSQLILFLQSQLRQNIRIAVFPIKGKNCHAIRAFQDGFH